MTTRAPEATITPTLDAVAAETEWKAALEPRGMDDVRALAKALRGSCAVPMISRGRGPDGRMLPKEPMAEPDIVGLLMLGRSLGIGTMQALNGIFVVEGRPTLAATTMLALVRSNALCEAFDFECSTTERCVVVAKRRGSKPTRVEWTIDMAKRAGAFQRQSSPWVTYPQAMLRARAISDACRMMFSDVLLGLYSKEEMDDSAAADRVLAAVDVDGTEAAVAKRNTEEAVAAASPETWLAQIEGAQNRMELDGIAKAIATSGLSTADAAVVRVAFATKRNALKKPASSPEQAAPAPSSPEPPPSSPERDRESTEDDLDPDQDGR